VNRGSKRISNNYGIMAVRNLAINFINAADTGRRFMLTDNSAVRRAKKMAKENGVIVKYDTKTADYFTVKMEVAK